TSRETFLLKINLVVLIAWLLFQSPALYYYIHVIPLTLVSSTVIVRRVLESKGAHIVLAGLSIAIAALAFTDASVAYTVGNKLDRENKYALKNAKRIVIAQAPNTHPLILAQNPAINWVLAQPELRLMSPHFVGFPLSNVPADTVIHEQHASYILVYKSFKGDNYSVEVAPLLAAA